MYVYKDRLKEVIFAKNILTSNIFIVFKHGDRCSDKQCSALIILKSDLICSLN